jgi:curved DNA-binding protein CbpA
MMDAYKLLGVAPDATDEEIKQAYRALVRKYHPDKYAGTDLADMATEKMKEINAAYEQIQEDRRRGGSNSQQSSANGQSYNSAYNSGRQNGAFAFGRIRQHVNNGNLDDAYALLMGMPDGERGSEWHFLMGCVLLRRGQIIDAQNHLDTACRIDPYNAEYRTVRDRLRAQTAASAGGYRTMNSAPSGCACSTCDICMTLACADLCCDCFCGNH